MSDPHDITHKILASIRDEIADIRGEIADLRQGQADIRQELRETRQELNERIDDTNERIDDTNKHLVEIQVRLSTEVLEVATMLKQLISHSAAQADVRPKVSELDRRVTSLEAVIDPSKRGNH
jgi:chromosome segregation ATPase